MKTIKETPYKVIFTTNEEICANYNKTSSNEVKSIFGLCDHKKEEILIDKEMSDNVILDTLFHERMHEFIYKKRLNVNSEEDFCFIMERYIEDILEIREEAKLYLVNHKLRENGEITKPADEMKGE